MSKYKDDNLARLRVVATATTTTGSLGISQLDSIHVCNVARVVLMFSLLFSLTQPLLILLFVLIA